MKSIFNMCVVAVLACSPPCIALGEDSRPARPNVVLLLTDDLGWQDVKCYDIDEPSPMETPNIDALAKKGVMFWQAYTSFNQVFTWDKIDQRPDLKKFLLVDPETNKLAHRDNVFCFDVLNHQFRKWWVDTVAQGVTDSGCDGVFIDQMHGFAWLRHDKSQEVQQAMGELMGALKTNMGPHKILLANNATEPIAKHVFPVIDASMFEHYSEELLSKESLLQDWENMLRLAKAGKMSVFRIGVEHDPDRPESRGGRRNRSERKATLARERIEYYLSCFLIGAQPYSYFQYGWGWTLDAGSLHEFPELRKPLGAPKGAYKRTTPDGWQFTREFEHASVWVNTETRQAKITWR